MRSTVTRGSACCCAWILQSCWRVLQSSSLTGILQCGGSAAKDLFRENLQGDVSGEVQLVRHGTPHVGPVGDKVISSAFHVSREKALQWQQDCDGKTFACLQGPWMTNTSGQGGTLGGTCKGLHPMPVMFNCVMELEPGTRYLLTLKMAEEKGGVVVSDKIGTVWGFQGVPRRKKGPDQNHFRWFQVHLLYNVSWL